MSSHGDRSEKRAKHSDPINYTCGACRKVHKFDRNNPYVCEKEIQQTLEE